MRFGFQLFLFLLLFGASEIRIVHAYTPSDVLKNQTTLIELSKDLEQELTTFDDFHKNPELLKKGQATVDHWMAYLKDPVGLQSPALSDENWKLFFNPLPHFDLTVPGQPRAPPVEILQFKAFDVPPEHSMEDIQGYVKARIGSETVATLKSEKIPALVYAGNEKSLAAAMGIEPSSLIQIPSFYEKWGITKWLEFRKMASPRLIFVIPPIRQYADHYSSMLAMAGISNSTIVLNVRDRLDYLSKLKDLSANMIAQMPQKPDYVVVGYTAQWKALLNNFGKAKTYRAEDVHGVLYHLNRSKDLPQSTDILLLGADRTLWGEATASLVEGALAYEPRAVYFMGSAGGLSNKVHLYDYTVPTGFANFAGTKIELKNMIGPNGEQTLVHGNSFSPAEQTIARVDSLLQGGIDTIDVEQSIIAQTIAYHNLMREKKINFGAVNLITDLPGSTLLGHRGENNLDRVDMERKEATRRQIVRLGFQSIKADLRDQPFSLCDFYLQKALP